MLLPRCVCLSLMLKKFELFSFLISFISAFIFLTVKVKPVEALCLAVKWSREESTWFPILPMQV